MEQEPILISEEAGFIPQSTEGVSSLIFVKNEKIYKLNVRNSFERHISDLQKLKAALGKYSSHIPETEIVECIHEGGKHTCVIQPLLQGKELKYLSREEALETLKKNSGFVSKLLEEFFRAIENKELYVDPVGYPLDPDFFNSLNLIYEKGTGKLMLCDVGLSPHEDTLSKFGMDFYDSENVKTYTEKMQGFRKLFLSL